MSDNTSNNKRIAKNTLFLYVRMLFNLVVSLYTTRAILAALGVTDFGIYNAVAGFVAMFAFLNTSMTNGIQRFYNYSYGKNGAEGLKQVYITSVQIQWLLVLILLILLETIGLWYINNEMVLPSERIEVANYIYQFSIISLAFVVLNVPYNAAVIAHEKMDYFAIVSMIETSLKLLFALMIPHIDSDKLLLYGAYMLGVSMLNFIMYYGYCKFNFKEICFKWNFDKGLFRSMLSFTSWNAFGTFAFMLRSQGVTVLLNSFFGVAVNAAQAIAAQVQSAILGFSNNVVVAFRPQMVQSYARGDNNRVKDLFYSLSKISYIILFMLSLPVCIEVSYILRLWLGDGYAEYTESFVILVLANMIVSSLHTPIVTIIHATGKIKFFQIVTSLIACSVIPISWALFKYTSLPPLTVYWVCLGTQLLNQICCLWVMKGVFPFSIIEYVRKVASPITIVSIIALLTSLATAKFIEAGFIRLFTICIVAFISVMIPTYLTMSKMEQKFIKQLLYKIIKKSH